MYILKFNSRGMEAVSRLEAFDIGGTKDTIEVSNIISPEAHPWAVKISIESGHTNYLLNTDLIDYFYKVGDDSRAKVHLG